MKKGVVELYRYLYFFPKKVIILHDLLNNLLVHASLSFGCF